MLTDNGITIEGVQIVMLVAIPLVLAIAIFGFIAFRRLKQRKK